MSRAKNPQMFVHLNQPRELAPWNEVLDKAVETHFKGHHIRCRTELSRTGRWISTFTHKGGATLTPALFKQVNSFIAGFMACENSYN